MIRLSIIGFGKIARDQHVPAIAAHPDFELAATAGGGRGGRAANVAHYANHAELLRERAGLLDAVAICTPPGPRTAIARECLNAGLDVLLEKPPTATLGELAEMTALAKAKDRTLFAGWHSQFAPAVTRAAELLRGEVISSLRIVWHEDVRQWHPGQDWVFAAGGYGVFDPGINALSIATAILPAPLIVEHCVLTVPEGRQSPIAAEVVFAGDGQASFDWRVTGTQVWTIAITTAEGRCIELTEGGSTLSVDGQPQVLPDEGEYPGIYCRFGELIAARGSQVDGEPLRIVADALLVASREVAPPFAWGP